MNRKDFLRSLGLALAVIAATLPTFIVNASLLNAIGMDPQKVFVSSVVSTASISLLTSYLCSTPFIVGPGITGVSFITVNLMNQGWLSQDVLWLILLSSALFFLANALKLAGLITDAFNPILRKAVTATLGVFLLIIAFQGASTALHACLGSMANPLRYEFWQMSIVFIAPVGLIAFLEKSKFSGTYLIAIACSFIAGWAMGIQTGHTALRQLPGPWTLDLYSLKDLSQRVGGLAQVIGGAFGLVMVQMLDVAGCTIAMSDLIGSHDDKARKNLASKIFWVVPIGSVFGLCGGSYGVSGPHCLHLSSAIGLSGSSKASYKVLTCLYFMLLFICLGLQSWIAYFPFYAILPVLMWVGFNMLRQLPFRLKQQGPDVIAGILMVLVTATTSHLLKGVAAGIWSSLFFYACQGKSPPRAQLAIGVLLAICLLFA